MSRLPREIRLQLAARQSTEWMVKAMRGIPYDSPEGRAITRTIDATTCRLCMVTVDAMNSPLGY